MILFVLHVFAFGLPFVSVSSFSDILCLTLRKKTTYCWSSPWRRSQANHDCCLGHELPSTPSHGPRTASRRLQQGSWSRVAVWPVTPTLTDMCAWNWNFINGTRQQSYSLVSDVIKVSFIHMVSLDAEQAVLALIQARALRDGCVVNENSLSRVAQSCLLPGRSCSPLLPGNNWKAV